MAREVLRNDRRALVNAACALACGLSAACAPHGATRVGVALPDRPAAGAVSGTTYTTADGAFSVAVPRVFTTDDGADTGTPAVHEDLRLEDGRSVVEGARVDFVMFGPSGRQADEIYHVVLAAPEPHRRYDDLARHADAIITGYLEQYDRQHVGAATEIVRKDVSVGDQPAIYAAYRYDFVTAGPGDDVQQRSDVSFCILAAPGHRLVMTVVERWPAALPPRSPDRSEQWRGSHHESGACDRDWLASLELDVAAAASLVYRRTRP